MSDMKREDWIVFGVVAVIIAILVIIACCSCTALQAGGTQTPNTVQPDIKAELKQVLDNKLGTGDIAGDLTQLVNAVSKVETSIQNIQNNIDSTYNSTVLIICLFAIVEAANIILWIVDIKSRKKQ